MSADMPSATDRLLERIAGLKVALAQYGMREHYECDDHYYSCPKALDPEFFDLTGDEVCECGADEHNAAVIAVLEADR